MADHPGLLGGGLPWREGEGGRALILVGLILLLFPMLLSRNPIFYWFRPWRTKGKAGGTDSKNAGDPYDLSAIYQEYKVRAAIGQEMANKDANRNGFLDHNDDDWPHPIPAIRPPCPELDLVLRHSSWDK